MYKLLVAIHSNIIVEMRNGPLIADLEIYTHTDTIRNTRESE